MVRRKKTNHRIHRDRLQKRGIASFLFIYRYIIHFFRYIPYIYVSIKHIPRTHKKRTHAFMDSKIVTCVRGFEPPTFWSVAKRSIQLSYWRILIMAVSTGLEPAISSVTDWHVNHYTMGPLVAGIGFEPTTSGL